jgi:hypothetical protein
MGDGVGMVGARRGAMTSRQSLHELVDQVDDDTAEELLEFTAWLLQEQAKVTESTPCAELREAR